MIDKVLTAIFGSKHERDVKRMLPIVQQINDLEPEISVLTDDQLREKTVEFRERLRPAVEALEAAKKEVPRDENQVKAARDDLQAALDDILPEAFAVCREAGKRVLNMRHFDVQLIGGMVLHHGKISEMKTGEGKTLVATLPAYLNALEGKGVHIVTVNDYLAGRDTEWMGRIYGLLGLTVGCIQHPADRRGTPGRPIAADITYGTNNEFGFDYLRDNMKYDLGDCVQRGSRLCDRRRGRLHPDRRSPDAADHLRARQKNRTDKYYKIDRIVPQTAAGTSTSRSMKRPER